MAGHIDGEAQVASATTQPTIWFSNNNRCPLKLWEGDQIERCKSGSLAVIGPENGTSGMELEEMEIQLQLPYKINAAGALSWKRQQQPGTTLKKWIYENIKRGNLSFLSIPVGMVLSLCTGVAITTTLAETCRRSLDAQFPLFERTLGRVVEMQKDPLDYFLSRNAEGMLKIFLTMTEAEKADLISVISSVIHKLLPTGVSQDGKSFSFLDPTSTGHMPVGISFRMSDSPFLSIFKDTAEIAVFAVVTLECFEFGTFRCQNNSLLTNAGGNHGLQNSTTINPPSATARPHLSYRCNGILTRVVRAQQGGVPFQLNPPLKLQPGQRYIVPWVSNGFFQACGNGSELKWHHEWTMATLIRLIKSYLPLDPPVLLRPCVLNNLEAVELFLC
ncbi:hypothetical protein AOL_s00169g224 [Orbilia oligospora ATCC 24927]|uniref:Uncharacterized protein n=2 Tax=Orbilia oligospora TaxID=2813651 RepID=G1XN21_ARTOA|nr:hypothetical protein AOL_s00169g224 [Orbilia oligospora ATCC 24927]EGX45618.1 hypothetical protein AOL_s00169g224 [Orbilia oligospora ATCC 24927]KAF3283339.1 hypothetical protein TWF970_001319 [Orbilia oligospora]